MSHEKDDKERNHKERMHLFDEKPKPKREVEPDPPKAKEAPPVATTREVKDGSWISNRFRH